jgi:hypothetical protein
MPLLVRISIIAFSSLVIGCSQSTDIQNSSEGSLAKVAKHYNGSITTTEIVNHSAKTGAVDTRYLKVDLRSPDLRQYYGTHLDLPVTACAYAAWHQLSHTKQLQTSYLKVTLNSADSIISYTIPAAELMLVNQGSPKLDLLIDKFNKRDVEAIANSFHIDGEEKYPADSLRPRLAQIVRNLTPVNEYHIEGFSVLNDTTTQGRLPRVKFLLSIPYSSSQTPHLIDVTITPATGDNQRFINGMRLMRR